MTLIEIKKGFENYIYAGVDYEYPANVMQAKFSELSEKHLALWYLDAKNKADLLKYLRVKGSDSDLRKFVEEKQEFPAKPKIEKNANEQKA